MQDEILDPETRVSVSVWARGGAAGLIGIFLGVALSILWQFALARLLGAAGLGDISLATTLLLVLTTLVPLGLDSSAMRYVSFHHARQELAQTLGIIRFTTVAALLLSLLATPLAIWSSDWLAVSVFGKPDLGGVLRIVLLGLPFAVLLQVLGSTLQGFKLIGTRLLAQQVVVPLARLGGLWVLLLLAAPVSAPNVAAIIAIACVLGALIPVVVVLRQSRTLLKTARATHTPSAGVVRYSARALLNSAAEQLNAALPVFLLGILSTSSAVGIFGAAFRAAMIVGLVLASLDLVAAAAMSSLFATHDLPRLRSLFAVITRWGITLALPIFLILILYAPDVMAVFGAEFRAGALVLQLLAVGQMLNVVTGSCRSLLRVTEHQRLDVINGFIGLFVGVAVSLLTIPSYGALGAALGASSYLALVSLLGLLQAYRVLRIQPYGSAFRKPLLSGIVAVGLALGIGSSLSFAADWIRLLTVSATLLGAYAASLLAQRLEPEDRIAFQSLIQRRS